LKMVVLPAPLGPISENTSFGHTSKETSFTAFRPPNCTDRFFASSSGAVMPPSAGPSQGGRRSTPGSRAAAEPLSPLSAGKGSGERPSFHPLRLHVALLPPEHALAVEGEELEEGADLQPAAVQA